MPKSIAYRCLLCRTKASGKPGMVSCPECGGRLMQLYGARSKKVGRRER